VLGVSKINHRLISHLKEPKNSVKDLSVYTTREVAICDDLLVTLLILVTEWYVFHDEMYVFVISCK
jgi:hypothetical protein